MARGFGTRAARRAQAQRDELKALRDEVKKLRNAEDVDEEALQVAVDNLRSEHRLFREDVRAVIESNEELQASLQEARGTMISVTGPTAAEGHFGVVVKIRNLCMGQHGWPIIKWSGLTLF